MITVAEIRKKSENLYFQFLKAFFLNEPFFPKIIPSDKKVSDNFAEMAKELEQLIENSKEIKGYGYSVLLKVINTRNHGPQSLPVEICFKDEKDFLKFIKKEDEFKKLKEDIRLIYETEPGLNEWIIPNIKSVIYNNRKWPGLLSVCRYFIETPKPNLYIRELPIANISSKFIEENKGVINSLLDFLIPGEININENEFEKKFNLKFHEPLVRIRILDKKIATEFYSGIDDLSIPLSLMERNPISCKTVFIMENKASFANIFNFLTLPNLDNCIALFGSGFKVGSLKTIKWLKEKSIYYWGDIDAHGFEILNQLRSFLPQTEAIMMDFDTLKQFENYIVPGTLTSFSILNNLKDSEKDLYKHLVETNQRLEQERISQSFVNEFLNKLKIF